MRITLWLIPVLPALALHATAHAQVVYENDFETSVGAEWSQTITEVTPAGARTFLGQFGSETVSLDLSALPAHDLVTVTFDLFVIRSWGGNAVSFGVDEWALTVAGGPTLLDTTFSNSPGDPTFGTQAYPEMYPGGSNPGQTGASEVDTLGYTFSGQPLDSVYKLGFTFA